VDYFPFKVLHKKWQYYLFTMLKQRVGRRAIKAKIDALWRKYTQGLSGVLWRRVRCRRSGEGLAYYLRKIRRQSPISLRRILSYDGQRVRYWYNDHKTKQRQEEEVAALTFIGRMVQHILPKGFHRHPLLWSPCHVQGQEGEGGTHRVDGGAGSVDQGDVSYPGAETYRARVLASTGP